MAATDRGKPRGFRLKMALKLGGAVCEHHRVDGMTQRVGNPDCDWGQALLLAE